MTAAADDAGGRRLRGLLLVCLGGWALFAGHYAILGRYRTASLDVLVFILTAGLFVLARGQTRPARQQLIGHLNITVASVGLVAASMLSGQSASMAVWYLVAIPLFAAHLSGVRMAAAWSVAAALMVAFVHASEELWTIEPEFVPTAWELFLGRATLVFVILGFAVASRSATDSHIALLEERERVIRRQSEEAQRQATALAEARDEALAAVEAKGQFLANMSHEIRTPLSGVIGMTELLLDTELSGDQREIGVTIGKSGRAVLSIVDDILDFSRLESTEVELEHQPFNLQACVEDVVAMLGATARERGVALETRFGAEIPTRIRGDGARMRQVLLNLVGNALKFTPKGSVEIRGRVPRRGWVEISVIDTGIGIAEDALPTLFAPFTQADASTNRRFGGSGLGLAISKRLVERMGGTIEARSALGQGSTFSVLLPALGTLSDVVVEPMNQGAPPRTTGERLPIRLLVAEDDPVNRDVCLRMLRKLGYQPDAVVDGRAAVQAVEDRGYDVVLMDMQMPEMDGVEATRRIRSFDVRSQPRIIALTANVLPRQRREFEAAGIDDFLAKPVRIEQLADVIDRQSMHPDGVRPERGMPSDPLERLRRLCAGSPGAFERMVSDHLANNARLHAEIGEAHRLGDSEALERALHSLKSSSAMFGSVELSTVCGSLETKASIAANAVDESALDELGEAIARARKRLEATLRAPILDEIADGDFR